MIFGESHITESVKGFISSKDKQFDYIFERVSDIKKDDYKNLLIYIDNLLNPIIHDDSPDLAYLHLHLHIPCAEPLQNALLEFICIKFFIVHLTRQCISAPNHSSYLDKQIRAIEAVLDINIQLGCRSGTRELKKKRQERKELRRLKKQLSELQDLIGNCSVEKFTPKCLINTLAKNKNHLLSHCLLSPYYKSVEDISESIRNKINPSSYVVLNSDYSRDDLDELEFNSSFDLIQEIENIVFLDCEGKSLHRQFNHTDLVQLNKREGTKFKKLIIISFDKKKFRLNRLISYLGKVASAYHIRPSGLSFNSYIMLPSEVDFLLHGSISPGVEVRFIGDESLIWQDFQEHVHEYENLYELISIKLRSIYSLCFNETSKNLILNDLFSTSIQEPKLISRESKKELLNLNQEARGYLLSSLTNVLEIVKKENLFQIINRLNGKESYDFVLPQAVLEYKEFIRIIRQNWEGTAKVNLTTWKDIDSSKSDNVVILDYRDTGRFNYVISPNMLEYKPVRGQVVKGLFFAMFFKYNYTFTSFDYLQTLYDKILQHPLRVSFFKWKELTSQLQVLKPVAKPFTHYWDLDNTYSYGTERESIIIEYSSGTKRSYYPSQLFVAKFAEDKHLFSIKAEEVLEEEDSKELFIQPLDSLYEDLNLFETTHEEEVEVNQLKAMYNLGKDELEHRLWKTLLKRKADVVGGSILYEKLKELIEGANDTMVRKPYFEHSWLDVKSNFLIPRSKRTFKIICDFLNIPEVYYRVLIKKRAKERLISRKSTSKMNGLIADLIERGMFDKHNGPVAFDDSFLAKHDLEEVGFNSMNLTAELNSLVDLLKPNLNLMKISTVELRQST